jgi:hypothetical protein
MKPIKRRRADTLFFKEQALRLKKKAKIERVQSVRVDARKIVSGTNRSFIFGERCDPSIEILCPVGTKLQAKDCCVFGRSVLLKSLACVAIQSFF